MVKMNSIRLSASSAVPDENDTLCALITKPNATPYQRLNTVVAVYGITIAVGCVVYVLYGTLDLKFPPREAFHEILDHKLDWVPNGLYLYVFVLVAYIGLLGLTYYCFGPKRKKALPSSKTDDACPCCPSVYKGGEKAIIAFIVVGITFQLGVGFFTIVMSNSWRNNEVKIRETVVNGLNKGIKSYDTTKESPPHINVIVDNIQKEYQCCGSLSAEDWVIMDKYTNSVPNSCCKGDTGDNVTVACGLGMDKDIINTQGCWTFLADKVRGYLRGSILLTSIVTGLEIAVVFSFWIYLSCKWCTCDQTYSPPSGTSEEDGHAGKAHNRSGHPTIFLEADGHPSQHKPHTKQKHISGSVVDGE